MVRREFLTVPDELVEYANAAVDWFEARGYSLKIEHNEVVYPYRPTLRCRRSRTTLLIEVATSVDIERLAEWGSPRVIVGEVTRRSHGGARA